MSETVPVVRGDELVEKVAWAICVADGLDPDEHVYGNQAAGFEDYGPRWHANARSEGQLSCTTDYAGMARAALSVAIEEAANIVAEHRRRQSELKPPSDRHTAYLEAAEHAIRALVRGEG